MKEVAGDEASLISTAAVTSIGLKEHAKIDAIRLGKAKLAEAIISV